MRYPIRRCDVFIVVMLLLLIDSIGFAQTDATWLNPVDGNWSDAANWSIDPVYPNNGSPAAGDAYNVTIDVTGSPYVIDVSPGITLNNLTLNSSDCSLIMRNGLNIQETLNLQAGAFHMTRGTLSNATVVGGPDESVVIGYDRLGGEDVTFDHVTLYVPVTVQAGYNRGDVKIVNDLAIEGTTFDARYEDFVWAGGRLTSQTHGDFLLSATIQVISSDGLTIDPTITVTGAGSSGNLGGTGSTILNHGVIQTLTSADRFTIAASEFTNQGLIEIQGGSTIWLNSVHWNNQGVIRLSDGELDLGGLITMSDVGVIERSAGTTVRLRGNFDNTGQTLALDAFEGGWELAGEISGGRISAEGDRELLVGSTNWSRSDMAYLRNVEVDPNIRVKARAQLTVGSDAVLHGDRLTIEDGGSAIFEDDVDYLTIAFANTVYNPGMFSAPTLGPNSTVTVHDGDGSLSTNNLGLIVIDAPEHYLHIPAPVATTV